MKKLEIIHHFEVTEEIRRLVLIKGYAPEIAAATKKKGKKS